VPVLRQITALRIDEPMRFGNSLIQLSNAIELAAIHGIPRIYAPGFWWIASNLAHDSSSIRLLTTEAPPEETILAGQFYYKESLQPLYLRREKSIDDFRHNLIRVRHQIPLLQARTPLPDEHLVIHIRSGDVFQGEGHPLYGQPPLAFYTLILRRWPWRKVTLVCEDRLNPVIDCLLAGPCPDLPVMEHRTGSLEEDLDFLLRARSLVGSIGTFMPAVLTLSSNIRRVTCFETLWYGRNLQRHADVVIVKDAVGDYSRSVLARNWQNSRQQRELMLHYPEHQLRVFRLPRNTGDSSPSPPPGK
jgi:hypothetical protein